MSEASKFVLTSGKSEKDTCHYWFVNNGGQGYNLGFPSVAFFLALAHVLSPTIVYEMVTNQPWYTFMWGTLLALFSNCSVICGTHLLWAHRAYKARWPLRVLFMIGHTMSGQWTIFKWASQHRGHHKWSDTDGDPHNPSRGFTYAHIGWIMLNKDPEAVAKAATLDYSDLLRDPIVRFQKDYYALHLLVFTALLPIGVPMVFWKETFLTSFAIAFLLPMLWTAHVILLINSAAHMFGDKPYSAKIAPADSGWLAAITFGGGYHNFHHMFPSDYTCSEPDRKFNMGRPFLNFMAKLGQAYDLKSASPAMVQKLKEKAAQEKTVNYGHTVFDEMPDSEYVVD
ncbi:Delta(9)-fatty-acid desaturase fat-6 [Halotydeus destructor]|nr:Delta(9)-fatty-acid desaturase fat-6 [Halotydeus destructor]